MKHNLSCFGLGAPYTQGGLTLWCEQSRAVTTALNILTPDALLNLAYTVGVEQLPEKLLGEFAIVIQDYQNNQVLFFVDHTGSRTLYYHHDVNRLVIATEEHLLFSQGSVPRQANLHYIAASFSAGYFLANPDLTYFDGVHRVKARTLYIWRDGQLTLKPYWQPELNSDLLHYPCEEDYVEAFQALFAEIVRFNLQDSQPVVSLLSGGLDSTAVTAMAAHLCAKSGKTLTTMSAVLPSNYVGSSYDESPYIALLNPSNLHKEMILDDWRGPFDVLFTDFFKTHNPHITSRYYLYQAFATKAIALGSRVILEGCFGEWGPSFHGQGYYAECLIRLKWVTLFRELYLHQKRYHLRWLGLGTFLKEGIYPCLPSRWQINLNKRPDLHFSKNLSFIRQSFIEQHGPDRVLLEKMQYSLQIVRPNHRKNQAAMLYPISRSPYIQSDCGKAVSFRHPFYDKRMIEFCLSLPGKFKVRHGYKRYAIRAGMKGLVPDALRFRITKEPFSPDYHERYNRQLWMAKEFLENLPISPLIQEVIDIPRLKAELNHHMVTNRCNTARDFTAMHCIPRALYLIAFLATF